MTNSKKVSKQTSTSSSSGSGNPSSTTGGRTTTTTPSSSSTTGPSTTMKNNIQEQLDRALESLDSTIHSTDKLNDTWQSMLHKLSVLVIVVCFYQCYISSGTCSDDMQYYNTLLIDPMYHITNQYQIICIIIIDSAQYIVGIIMSFFILKLLSI